MTTYVCPKCRKEHDHQVKCCDTWTKPICERPGCHEPGTRTICGMGYLASVCETHYQRPVSRSPDAIKFRYAEG